MFQGSFFVDKVKTAYCYWFARDVGRAVFALGKLLDKYTFAYCSLQRDHLPIMKSLNKSTKSLWLKFCGLCWISTLPHLIPSSFCKKYCLTSPSLDLSAMIPLSRIPKVSYTRFMVADGCANTLNLQLGLFPSAKSQLSSSSTGICLLSTGSSSTPSIGYSCKNCLACSSSRRQIFEGLVFSLTSRSTLPLSSFHLPTTTTFLKLKRVLRLLVFQCARSTLRVLWKRGLLALG